MHMPDVAAKSAKTSAKTAGRSKPILSIRARLIVVALLAIAPLMVERVRGLERARVERAELARSQVIDLTRGGADAQREIVSSMRVLLQVVARAYVRMPSDEADCSRALSNLTGLFRGFAGSTSRESTAGSNAPPTRAGSA
jgi:hypothetical protein